VDEAVRWPPRTSGLASNTAHNLINDIEALREHLGVDLQAQLTSLTDPVADIRHTVAGDREELARILTRAQHIADDVRRARESARSGADNVAGPNR
jgi:hypothetical protein